MKPRPYRCNHCKRIIMRESVKRWMKSFCDRTGKVTRLWRVD